LELGGLARFKTIEPTDIAGKRRLFGGRDRRGHRERLPPTDLHLHHIVMPALPGPIRPSRPGIGSPRRRGDARLRPNSTTLGELPPHVKQRASLFSSVQISQRSIIDRWLWFLSTMAAVLPYMEQTGICRGCGALSRVAPGPPHPMSPRKGRPLSGRRASAVPDEPEAGGARSGVGSLRRCGDAHFRPSRSTLSEWLLYVKKQGLLFFVF
jgi:hypothetical protein